MDIKEIKEFETTISEIVRNVLNMYQLILGANNITVTEKVNTGDSDYLCDYSSELEIVFYKNTEFDDIIEFFIFRNGQKSVTEKEVEEYLKTELDKKLL